MNTIVIYESATGFTEQYAKWIAEALDCPCKPLKQVSGTELTGIDRVIFGGWVMGGGIAGLEKLRGMVQPYAVFAVGAAPVYDEVVSAIQEQSKLGEIPLFYMEGGIRFEKLGFAKKAMLKTLKNVLSKKKNRSQMDDVMVQALQASYDHATQEQILPLVDFISV